MGVALLHVLLLLVRDRGRSNGAGEGKKGRGKVMAQCLPSPDQLSAYQQAGLHRHHGTEPIKLVGLRLF